jgi:hypothetical protein
MPSPDACDVGWEDVVVTRTGGGVLTAFGTAVTDKGPGRPFAEAVVASIVATGLSTLWVPIAELS